MSAIERRLVLLFPGFEPLPLAFHSERFRRGAEMAADVWGLQLGHEPADAAPAGADTASRPMARYVLSGAGWRTETDLAICDWAQEIAVFGRESPARRLGAGFAALADFALSGTAFRYFRTSWRYGLFFLYPCLFALATLLMAVAFAALPVAGGLPAIHLLWSLPLGAAFVALVLRHAIRRLHFLTLMDDWAFARALARRSHPAIEARLAAQAAAIGAGLARSETYDEIVVAAHSLGAGLAAIALAEALSRRAAPSSLGFLSVGASLLKTALHPAARAQREAVRALVEDHRILWVEVQSVSDPMNFYRSNPALSLGIRGGRTPVVHRISLGKIVAERTRRRIKRDLFRRHRQFVYGAETRHAYAFHMILLGPVSLARFAAGGDVNVQPLAGACEPPPFAGKTTA